MRSVALVAVLVVACWIPSASLIPLQAHNQLREPQYIPETQDHEGCSSCKWIDISKLPDRLKRIVVNYITDFLRGVAGKLSSKQANQETAAKSKKKVVTFSPLNGVHKSSPAENVGIETITVEKQADEYGGIVEIEATLSKFTATVPVLLVSEEDDIKNIDDSHVSEFTYHTSYLPEEKIPEESKVSTLKPGRDPKTYGGQKDLLVSNDVTKTTSASGKVPKNVNGGTGISSNKKPNVVRRIKSSPQPTIAKSVLASGISTGSSIKFDQNKRAIELAPNGKASPTVIPPGNFYDSDYFEKSEKKTSDGKGKSVDPDNSKLYNAAILKNQPVSLPERNTRFSPRYTNITPLPSIGTEKADISPVFAVPPKPALIPTKYKPRKPTFITFWDDEWEESDESDESWKEDLFDNEKSKNPLADLILHAPPVSPVKNSPISTF